MHTITSVFTSEYRVKGSRFLGFLCPSENDSNIGKHLDEIRREHPTATHHCYAYLINPNKPVEFSTDAGEPGGTAGLPILNTLKSHDLMNVILVVVRYYGGTKLGKSGLIDAYHTTAHQSIQSATLKELVFIEVFRLKYKYSQQSLIDKWKNSFPLIELDSTYMENVELSIGCPKQQAKQFEAAVSAQKHQLIDFETDGESFHIEE